MSKWIGRVLAVTGLALAIGAMPAAGQDQEKGKKPKRDRNVILPDEIAEKPDITNAYDAIQRLRPQWLKAQRAKLGSGSGASASEGYRPESCPTDRSGQPRCPDAGGVSAPSVSYGEKRGMVAVLYLDEVKQDQLEELRNIRVAEIAEIRYLNGTEATGRYGEGHTAGAVLLKTNRLGR